MLVRGAKESDQLLWDVYVEQHHDGLPYHFFAWQQAIHAAYGFEPHPMLVEADGCIKGILPLIDFKVPLSGRRFVSLPYCDAAAVLADDDRSAELLLQEARRLGAAAKGCSLRASFKLLPNRSNQTDKVRMLLDLPGSADELLTGMRAKLRSQVKKPQRDGLTAKLGGVELVEEFYSIFAENMHDLGSPVHSKGWIEAVIENFGERARVGVVYTPDGLPAAAGIILLHPQVVSIPWASALRKYNRLNPNMLLYWTFLSYAADNGYPCFDFGRSTPGEGTYRFKEQWGAQPQPLYWYDLAEDDNSSNAEQGVSAKRQLATDLWQKLPLAAANFIGPRLRKYISL